MILTSDWLNVQEFAELVGCSVARLRILVRCGLLQPWSRYISYDPAPPMAAVPQLVVMTGNGIEVVTFSPDLLTDPRFLVLATNSVDPKKWGEGWEGPRDARLVGLLDSQRIKVLQPGKKLTPNMKRISRISTRAAITGRCRA